MRAEEFTKCKGCGKGVAHTGLPIFWRVKIERMGIDGNAVRQTDAMERYFGGHAGGSMGQSALAVSRVFQDPIIAKPIDGIEPVTALLCETCSTKPLPLALLAEVEAKEVTG